MSEAITLDKAKGVQSKGILHFTISVRDHKTAAQFYADLLGCEIQRISDHFAFMKTGNDYFVLAKMANHQSEPAEGHPLPSRLHRLAGGFRPRPRYDRGAGHRGTHPGHPESQEFPWPAPLFP
jgi:catechol 2,3-dioxygenase-like lactoylglutathione lyase family enzyme